MGERRAPRNAGEVVDIVRGALADGQTLELAGTGTRRDFGRPVEADVYVDLSALSGIRLYEPEELVMVVAPGTPMAEIDDVLARHGQHLAFEPPDLGPLWGAPGGAGTIGGAIMAGRAGPRRLAAGGARDHVLGARAVNGFGEEFACGGRVVKNVTGFDIARLLAGSFGTLCAVTELTLKVLPRPADSATVVLVGLGDDAAIEAMRLALNETSANVSSAAHLPAAIAGASSVGEIAASGEAATLLRIEGPAPAVAAQTEHLLQAVGRMGPCSVLGREPSRRAWTEVADAAYFRGDGGASVWRLSVPPSRGAEVGRRLEGETGGRHFYDLAGGAVWVGTPPADDAHSETIRRALAQVVDHDGHATLVRAAAPVRRTVPPFQPLAPELAALTRRVKAQFDPRGIFNPGRMYEDF